MNQTYITKHMIFVPSKYRPCEKRIVPRVAIPSVTLENHPFLVVLREEQKTSRASKERMDRKDSANAFSAGG